jgi:hypothetical protein
LLLHEAQPPSGVVMWMADGEKSIVPSGSAVSGTVALTGRGSAAAWVMA